MAYDLNRIGPGYDTAHVLTCTVSESTVVEGEQRLVTAMATVQELAQPYVDFLHARGYGADIDKVHTLIMIGTTKKEGCNGLHLSV